MTPTAEQAAIISAAEGDEDLMVIARAGCAKTSTLVMLTPRLGASGRLPTSILALAFNVKIKKELEERLPKTVGNAPVLVQTLNGMGHKALWQWLRRPLEVDTKKTYNSIRSVTSSQNLSLSKDEFADVQNLINAGKSLGFVPKGSPLPGKPLIRDTPDGVEEIFDWADVTHSPDLEVIFRACMVDGIKQAFAGTVDFNDQIYLPVVFQAPFQKYDTIMVDEAQDLSAMNHQMILRACARRLIVVGDDKQAIYAFRGALGDSLAQLEEGRQFKRLTLNTTFRCASSIVARAQAYVPDFLAAPGNPEGEVMDWSTGSEPWTKDSVPLHSAIICRNNAPLFKLAFKLLRQGRGVCMLGNDIGKSLERALDKACGKKMAGSAPRALVLASVDAYFQKEIAKAKTPRRKDSLSDRWECLQAIVQDSGDLAAARATCHKLFENPNAVVTLSSGHKSKGLEWDTVIHLDSFRIPSQYAFSPEAQRQEENLRYVIETRAKTRLILANLDDFQ